MIQVDNLIAGKIVAGKQSLNNFSPVDRTEISQVNLLSDKELRAIFTQAKGTKNNGFKTDYSELSKLAQFILENRLKFVDRIIRDAGFTQKDAEG